MIAMEAQTMSKEPSMRRSVLVLLQIKYHQNDEQDVDKAIERARIFYEMGTDATFIENQPSLDAIKKIGSTVPDHQCH